MYRKILVLVLIVVFCMPADADAARKKRKARRIVMPTAISAILWNVTDNKVMYGKQVDRRVYPASTTKVMTVLLALENLQLDQNVTARASALNVEPTKLGLVPGQQYKVRDLIYACLLKSSNDAANVLAESVGGSQKKFVIMMNTRARQLGAKNTRFANAHGLPSKKTQYTTARDMAFIFRGALKQPFFKEAISKRYKVIYSIDGKRSFLKSHNKTLFMGWKKDVYGKTGYTIKAKTCFVGFYTHKGKTYVVDVFGCRKRWEDIKFIIERYGKVDL